MYDIKPPEFFTTERNGKLAIWVKMPDGDAFNIADLFPSELSDDVRAAIERSFARGAEAARMQMERGAFELRKMISLATRPAEWRHNAFEEDDDFEEDDEP